MSFFFLAESGILWTWRKRSFRASSVCSWVSSLWPDGSNNPRFLNLWSWESLKPHGTGKSRSSWWYSEEHLTCQPLLSYLAQSQTSVHIPPNAKVSCFHEPNKPGTDLISNKRAGLGLHSCWPNSFSSFPLKYAVSCTKIVLGSLTLLNSFSVF